MKTTWVRQLFLALLCVCLATAADDQVSVFLGGTAVMTCPVGDISALRVTWTKDGAVFAEIPQGGRPLIPPAVADTVSVNGSDVIIQSVGLPGEGSYVCSVLGADFATQTATVELLVRVQPQAPIITVLGAPDSSQLELGANITLVCQTWGGRPASQLVWYRDGQPVNGTYATVGDPNDFGNATLTLPLTVTMSDDGVVYECVSAGPAPIVPQTVTVTLNVAMPTTTPETTAMAQTTVPSTVADPNQTTDMPVAGVSVLAGSAAMMSCGPAVNIPVARVTWEDRLGLVVEQTTGGSPLIPPSWQGRVSLNGSDIIMQNVTIADEGQYTCTVLHRDTFERFTDTEDLFVRVQPNPPVIDVLGAPGASQLQLGVNVTLVCQTWGGRPASTLVWHRDGQPVNGRYTPGEWPGGLWSAILTVTFMVTEADHGVTYECTSSGPQPIITQRVEVTIGVILPTTPPAPTTTIRTTTEEAATNPAQLGSTRDPAQGTTQGTSNPAQGTTQGTSNPSQGTSGPAQDTTQGNSGSSQGTTKPEGTGTAQTTEKGSQTNGPKTTETPDGGTVEAQSGDPLLTEPQIIFAAVGSAMLLVILVAIVVAAKKGCFMKKRKARLMGDQAGTSVGSSYRANILYSTAENGYDGPASEMEMKKKELIKPPPERII